MSNEVCFPVPNTTGKKGDTRLRRKPHKVSYTDFFLTDEARRVMLRAAELGLRDQTAAELACMKAAQLYALLEENEEFAAEYRQARRKGDFLIANTLTEVALQDRDVRALIYLARIRLGWREDTKVDVEITGPGGGAVQHEHKAKLPADATAEDAAAEWARFREAKVIEQ